MYRITTVVGTRPEIIRLSRIVSEFDKIFKHRLIFSSQNSDRNLSEIFFEELRLRQPDLVVKPSHSSFANFLGEFMTELERDLIEFPADLIVTLGDTNTGLATIVAKKLGIPIYHLEAGNRSFDSNVPEEINRKIIDHFADFNLVYTESSRQNLLREGLHPRNICLVGSPLREVLKFYEDSVDNSRIIERESLNPKRFFLVSIHRQENVNNRNRLLKVFGAINFLAEQFNQDIIVSTHPRTLSRIEQGNLKLNKLIRLCKPFGYFDYIKLQKECRVIVSDSGTIGEEASILGLRAVSLRDSIERPEAIESASLVLSGTEAGGLKQSINYVESSALTNSISSDYLISDTSKRVVNFILSTRPQYEFWNGIRINGDN